MFGLMKAHSCRLSALQRETRRQHYCGTCKTIGRLYGQKSRLFLNYDAVFLSEILMALGSPPQSPFPAAFVSRNCLAIPQATQIPWALQYAATANLLLAQFKLLDHIADTKSGLVRIAHRFYSPDFAKAQRQLRQWRFPLDEFRTQLSLQSAREQEPAPSLARLAEPTANATRLVFAHGAVQAGASAGIVGTMAGLGSVFGQIAYLADAIQDQRRDVQSQAFNALTATQTLRDKAADLLRSQQREMLTALRTLPIGEDQKAIFTARLRANLAPLLTGSVLPMADQSDLPEVSEGKPRKRPRAIDGCDDCCCDDTCCSLGCCECLTCFCS